MSSKKIAIITDTLASGGIARVAKTIGGIFIDKKVNCRFFIVYDEFIDNTLKLDVNFNSAHKKYWSRLNEISQEIKRGNYTHVFIMTMGKLSVAYAPFLHLKNKNYVCEHISFESYSTIVRIVKLLTFRLYNKVIVLTSHDYNYLLNRRIKAYCIYNPNPFMVQRNIKYNNSKKYLAVGHLINRKGYIRMLSIWKMYIESGGGGSLTILGEGEQKCELDNYIKEQGICSVTFLNSTNNIEEIYRTSDVLLNTSYAEGLPMTLIEAQSFGLPVISYDIKTGPGEIIINGVNGFLVEDGDNISFLKSMMMIENNSLYKNLSRKSLELSERFSKDAIFSKWEELINE